MSKVSPYLLKVVPDQSKDKASIHQREGIMDEEGKAGVQVPGKGTILQMGECSTVLKFVPKFLAFVSNSAFLHEVL